jgi:hypothetical protein
MKVALFSMVLGKQVEISIAVPMILYFISKKAKVALESE